MSFKLLAIRPMPGTDPKFLKNLKPVVIYKFYQEYAYYTDETKKQRIDDLPIEEQKNHQIVYIEQIAHEVPKDFYSSKKPSINISAVVGKNGSGKSSLFDLLFYDVFYKSRKKYRNDNGFLLKVERRIEEEEDKRKKLNDELEELKKRKKKLLHKIYKGGPSLQGQAIFSIREDNPYKLEIDELYYEIFQKENELKKKVGDLNYQNGINKCNDESKTELYFHDGEAAFNNSENKVYHIVLNYSKYSLNSKVQGDWLNALFHKNDNYVVPVVLNPMKTEGNIKINTEYHLSNSRLMLFPETINLLDKELDYIEFSFKHYSEREIDSEGKFYSFSIINGNLRRKVVYNNSIKGNDTLVELKRMIESSINNQYGILTEIGSESIPFDELGTLNKNLLNLKNILSGSLSLNLYIYLIRKIFKYFEIQDQTISENHNQLEENQVPEIVDVIKDFKNKIERVLKDESHRALKIHQIFYLLKKDVFNEFINSIDFEDYKNRVEISGQRNPSQFRINYKEFLNYRNKNKISKLSQVPGAYFRLNFGVKNEGSTLSLSSGESHFLTVINSILYHLANIESIQKSYEYINIIFDEVELYFHPEYQRIFISSLIKAIEQLNLKRIKGINILFSTHSPFILSDIPSQNILRLENGEPKYFDASNSFAANIYDLLDDDFFLKDAVIGEFAKNKIQELCKKDQYDTEDLRMIELVGDDFLRGVLLDRAKDMKDDDVVLMLRITQLEKELKTLKGE